MTDKELFKQYLEKYDSLKDQRFSLLNKDIHNGEFNYLRMKFKGSSIFNPEWINRIEDCMYELDQIVNNPREVTTSEGSIVPIELARKINYESVQHLASHSQYVKEVTDEGDVIPAKILGLYNKEELHTYENRFIATFIRHLVLFIDKRYEYIKKTISLDEKEIMYVKNKSLVDGQEVEIETKITVTRVLEDDLSVAARNYIERIKKLKEYVGYYYGSRFMKEFKTEKDVRRPIIMTNILRKNPLYRKCYETFLFIEKFDSLGVAFKVDRDFQEFNEKERDRLTKVLLPSLLFLENTDNNKIYKSSKKVYKPKLLPSIDDESFLYDDLVKGPIEFVRTDEAYIKYLKDRSPSNLPTNPNKSEKLYFKKEFDLKRDLAKENESIDALLARVRREIEKYEKKVEKLIEKREVEEAKMYEEYLKKLRKYEQDILDKKRAEIIAAAKEQANDIEDEEYRKNLEKEAELQENSEKIEEKVVTVSSKDDPEAEHVNAASEDLWFEVNEADLSNYAPIDNDTKEEAKK